MRKQKMHWPARIVLAAAVLAGAVSCLNVTRKLSLEEREFLDKTSLIISRSEKKNFLQLPAEKRKEFMEEFWKRRDPDPYTEVNEFKVEYFKRIDEANRLFREGSKKSNWRTDRGRIYVLLGEPDRRDVFPTGYSFYEPPVEIWYYGFFRIIFVDYYREGIYRLEPASAWQISQINNAQIELNRERTPASPGERKFDFSLQHKRRAGDISNLEFLVPFKTISFSENPEKKTNEANLTVQVEILDARSNEKIAARTKEFPLAITAAELEKIPRFLALTMEFQLKKGRYLVQVTIENSVDKAKAQREFDLKI